MDRAGDKGALSDLAIFGGPRLFTRPRPIGQLAAPSVDQLMGLLAEPLASGELSNHGPQERALEAELAEYHGVRHCIALANAALGLTMLMRVLARGRRGKVVMPAFSFRGLLHFAQWAGQQPSLCDVDPDSHALCPQALRRAIDADTICVLAVTNANEPGNLDAIAAVAAAAGVPLIIDSVYAIGSSWRGQRLGGFGLAEVYSLHATKLLHGFEGGYVTTNDDALAGLLRWLRDADDPAPPPPGWWGLAPLRLDARLNEVHAATGRLALRQLPETIARNRRRHAAWQQAIAGRAGLRLVPYPDPEHEQSNYQVTILDVATPWPLSRDQTLALLQAEGMAIVSYYSPALHRSGQLPAGQVAPALPVSERLAERFIRLPVGELLDESDIAAVGRWFTFIETQGAALAQRLESRSTP